MHFVRNGPLRSLVNPFWRRLSQKTHQPARWFDCNPPMAWPSPSRRTSKFYVAPLVETKNANPSKPNRAPAKKRQPRGFPESADCSPAMFVAAYPRLVFGFPRKENTCPSLAFGVPLGFLCGNLPHGFVLFSMGFWEFVQGNPPALPLHRDPGENGIDMRTNH